METATKSSFQKYPAYKDSGVEWLGEIPEHWDISRLRNIFTFSKGLTITKENLQVQGIYCVNYGEIHSKFGFEVKPEIHQLKCVSDEYLISNPNSLLRKGDFIFADTSEDIEGSGNFTYLNSNLTTFAGYHTIIARLKIPINERFSAYVIASQSFRNQIRSRVKGVKVYSITQSLLKMVSFWIPDEEEQTAIANFLDNKTAKIEKAIAQKQKLIALLKERKQILIQDLVTGKKVWNKDKKAWTAPSKTKDSGVEWIGEIPEHYKVIKLGFKIDILSGYAFPSNGFSSRGIKLLRGINVGVGCIRWNETVFWPEDKTKGLEAYFLNLGDIIVGMDRPFIGNGMRVSVIQEKDLPCLLLQRVTRLKAKKGLSKDFLALILKSKNFVNYFLPILSGVSVPHISPNQIKDYPICLPSQAEQEHILSFTYEQTAKMDQVISLQQTQIEKLKEYKATLIDSAVTGKIKVIDV